VKALALALILTLTASGSAAATLASTEDLYKLHWQTAFAIAEAEQGEAQRLHIDDSYRTMMSGSAEDQRAYERLISAAATESGEALGEALALSDILMSAAESPSTAARTRLLRNYARSVAKSRRITSDAKVRLVAAALRIR